MHHHSGPGEPGSDPDLSRHIPEIMTVSTRPLDMLEVDAALDQERDKEAPIAEGSAVESTAEASIAPDDANDE